MKQISIPNDDSPPEVANRLNIAQDNQGDIHIWLDSGNEPYSNREVRIRTWGGGGHNYELIEEFVALIRKAEQIAAEHPRNGIEIRNY